VIARRLIVALVLSSVAPAALRAQRGGAGGFGRGRLPGSLTREAGLVVPTQVNMINLLIAHRQDVALSDSQFMRVIGLKRTLDSTNAPTMRRLDSLSRLFRGGTPIFSEPSVARRDSIAEARSVMRELLAVVRENNDAARDKAYELLNEQQLLKAREVESAAEKAIAEEEQKRKP
jgi:hypothetical protein